MKKGWEYKTLKEASIIYGNYGLSVSSIPYNGVRYLRITDITENGNLNDDKVSADISGGQTQEELQEGDILFARTGATVGKTLIYKKEFGKCLFAGYLIRYRLNKDIVIPQFIHHFTHSSGYYKWVSSNQKAAAQPNIGAKIYNELRIPIPPLSEQKEIVEYLDSSFAKIDKLKANVAKNLEEAKALFQSALKDALEPKDGWEEKTMDEVCILSQGLAINSKTKHLLVEKSSIPLLRIKDMKDGTREIFVDDKNYPPKCLAQPDELIYTRTGTLGLIFTGMFGIVHNNCFKIKLDESILNKFYYMYYVGSDNFRNMILSIASRAAQPDITHKLFKVQKIQFPSLAEQQSIVSFLDSLNEKVNTLQQNYSRICDECDALKQAILRQVFE